MTVIRSIVASVVGLTLTACDGGAPADFQNAFVVAPLHLGDDQVAGWSPSTPSDLEHVSSLSLSSANVQVPEDGRPLPFLVLLVRLGPSATLLVSVNDVPLAELVRADPELELGEAVVEIIDRIAQAIACGLASDLGATPQPFDDPENAGYFRETASLQSHEPVFLAVPWNLLRPGNNQIRFEVVGSTPGDPDDQAIIGFAALSSLVDGCALYFDLTSSE